MRNPFKRIGPNITINNHIFYLADSYGILCIERNSQRYVLEIKDLKRTWEELKILKMPEWFEWFKEEEKIYINSYREAALYFDGFLCLR